MANNIEQHEKCQMEGERGKERKRERGRRESGGKRGKEKRERRNEKEREGEESEERDRDRREIISLGRERERKEKREREERERGKETERERERRNGRGKRVTREIGTEKEREFVFKIRIPHSVPGHREVRGRQGGDRRGGRGREGQGRRDHLRHHRPEGCLCELGPSFFSEAKMLIHSFDYPPFGSIKDSLIMISHSYTLPSTISLDFILKHQL